MLQELRQNGCSILVSTHVLDSVEELWDKGAHHGAGGRSPR